MSAELVLPGARAPLPANFTVMTPAYVDTLSVHQTRMLIDVMRRGGVVWFMSDSAYAAGVDPRHPLGLAALDALLDHANNPIPLTAADEALAAKVIRFDSVVRSLTARFWPGGLGIRTKAASWSAWRMAKGLHATDGIVVRVSQSIIERQLSATARLPITSAAMRANGQLVCDGEEALRTAIHLHEERTPGLRTIFVRDPRRRPRLRAHSTMVSVQDSKVHVLRYGSVDVDDAQRAAISNHGVDWSDAT